MGMQREKLETVEFACSVSVVVEPFCSSQGLTMVLASKPIFDTLKRGIFVEYESKHVVDNVIVLFAFGTDRWQEH